MAGTLTVLGTLILAAGWSLPSCNTPGATAHAFLEAAAAALIQLPDKLNTESSTVAAKRPESLAGLSSRLDTADQKLDQQALLIQRALEAAQKTARDAAVEQSNPAASPAAREQAAARFKQATDLIARLKAMQDRIAQNKQQVSELKSRKPSTTMGAIVAPPVPKHFSESVAQLEDSQRLFLVETQQTANLAFSLQDPAAVTSATPPRSDDSSRKIPEPAPPPPAPAPAAAPSPVPQPANPGTQQPDGSGAGATRSSPSAAPPTPAPTAALPSMAEHVSSWFAQLRQGNLQYKVPTTMYWKESSTVTVRIQGPHAGASSALPDASGSGTVKVSDRMKVVLSCPDNPDEFTIATQEGTDEIQFVPADNYTTWNWSVTPKYTGPSQKLSVKAWVLYPGQDDKVRLELPVYTANIDVHVPGLGESLKRLFEGDTDYWLRYGLPGGGGFIFVAGALAGLRKWISARKGKESKPLTPAAK